MPALLRRAKWIFLVVLVLYIFSYGLGFAAGKLNLVNYRDLQKSPVAKASRNFERYIPGYSHLLNEYKEWHDKVRKEAIQAKDHWALGKQIFLNNWLAANITMIIRSVLVLPITMSVFGKFFQGVVFAQTPASSHIYAVFISEFGGYYLTICGALCLALWTIFYRFFKFACRMAAFIAGLKILGLAFAVSSVGMLAGSIIETDFIMSLYEKLPFMG